MYEFSLSIYVLINNIFCNTFVLSGLVKTHWTFSLFAFLIWRSPYKDFFVHKYSIAVYFTLDTCSILTNTNTRFLFIYRKTYGTMSWQLISVSDMRGPFCGMLAQVWQSSLWYCHTFQADVKPSSLSTVTRPGSGL